MLINSRRSNNIRPWGYILCVLVGGILLYLSVYLFLSMQGSYSDELVGGKSYYSSGMPVHDSQVWQPRGIVELPYTNNFWADGFWILIALDRRFWHPDRPIEEVFRKVTEGESATNK